MKETIFDVLMYLFEHYMEDELEILPDSDSVRTELLEAGFPQLEINKAFDWLESLSAQRVITTTVPTSFRIFSTEEKAKIDLECQDLLLFLERTGILNPKNREIVIDRALALENEEISIEKLKWIILLVLLSQPDEEIAFSRMEDMIYDLVPTYLN
jgi:Smg protein